MMIIDRGFYSITQANMSINTQNNVASQDFAQLLNQTMQSQEVQNQIKISGNPNEDLKNGLISKEEYEIIDIVMDGAMIVAGWDMAQKMGKDPASLDINFDPFGGRVKQKQILANGSKVERAEWLNSYKKVLENNQVIPQDGKRAVDAAIKYINKALNDL